MVLKLFSPWIFKDFPSIKTSVGWCSPGATSDALRAG